MTTSCVNYPFSSNSNVIDTSTKNAMFRVKNRLFSQSKSPLELSQFSSLWRL